jgi:hypothetical protein
MKSSFYRPMMALALALGVTACGGKATFDIKGQVIGLQYNGLVLTDTVSGTKVTVNAPVPTTIGTTPFQLPNSIEYGTPYNVQIVTTATDNPPHQTCTVLNGADTAGRLATINITVSCSMVPHILGGSITITNKTPTDFTTAEVTGLTLTNGSTFPAMVAIKDQPSYAFGGIPYGTTYGLILTQQPTKKSGQPIVTCVLATPAPDPALPAPTPPTPPKGMSADKLSYTLEMTDKNAVVNVECTAGANAP